MKLAIMPAYSRKYANSDAALSDWNNGLDFKIVYGPYLSIRDFPDIVKQYGGVEVY